MVGRGITETGNNLLNSQVYFPTLNTYVRKNGQMWMASVWQASNAALPDTNVILSSHRYSFPFHNPRGGSFTGSNFSNCLSFLLSTFKISRLFSASLGLCGQPSLVRHQGGDSNLGTLSNVYLTHRNLLHSHYFKPRKCRLLHFSCLVTFSFLGNSLFCLLM